jgi:crotonobetainyl-CoA:carnitine CoA-transferase CaiB-like acyl-CoA transferase
VPYGAFPSSDGYVFISAGNNQTWHELLDALGAQHLKDVDEYSTNPQRVMHREAVTQDLSAATSRFTSSELVGLLAAARIPHSPVQTLDQVLGDEQVHALGQFTALHHDAIANFTTLNLPMTFDGAYPEISQAPPTLGADTRGVLASLGLSEAEIADLLAQGVVQQAESGSDRMATEATAKRTEGDV